MTNRHFVHVYGVARFKFAVDGCADHAAAIEAARHAYFEKAEPMLNRDVRDEATLEPPNGNRLQLISTDSDEEIVGFLVDEAGDENFTRTVAYDEDGKPKRSDTATTRVLIAVEGGNVQGAVADCPGVSVIVLDYDTEGADADRVFAIPQGNGGFSDAFVGGHSAEHNPAFIDGAENADLSRSVRAQLAGERL